MLKQDATKVYVKGQMASISVFLAFENDEKSEPKQGKYTGFRRP